jgi:hypothetical protein
MASFKCGKTDVTISFPDTYINIHEDERNCPHGLTAIALDSLPYR